MCFFSFYFVYLVNCFCLIRIEPVLCLEYTSNVLEEIGDVIVAWIVFTGNALFVTPGNATFLYHIEIIGRRLGWMEDGTKCKTLTTDIQRTLWSKLEKDCVSFNGEIV